MMDKDTRELLADELAEIGDRLDQLATDVQSIRNQMTTDAVGDDATTLQGIVRYHGANDVLDALLVVAGEAYGPDRAFVRVLELLTNRANGLEADAATERR